MLAAFLVITVALHHGQAGLPPVDDILNEEAMDSPSTSTERATTTLSPPTTTPAPPVTTTPPPMLAKPVSPPQSLERPPTMKLEVWREPDLPAPSPPAVQEVAREEVLEPEEILDYEDVDMDPGIDMDFPTDDLPALVDVRPDQTFSTASTATSPTVTPATKAPAPQPTRPQDDEKKAEPSHQRLPPHHTSRPATPVTRDFSAERERVNRLLDHFQQHHAEMKANSHAEKEASRMRTAKIEGRLNRRQYHLDNPLVQTILCLGVLMIVGGFMSLFVIYAQCLGCQSLRGGDVRVSYSEDTGQVDIVGAESAVATTLRKSMRVRKNPSSAGTTDPGKEAVDKKDAGEPKAAAAAKEKPMPPAPSPEEMA